MGKVEIAPMTAADYGNAIAALHGVAEGPPTRVAGFAGKIEGRVIGVGGIAFYDNGARLAFCEVGDEARSYKVSLHRAALMTLELARRVGVKRLVVTEEKMHEKTPGWLLRLGFEKRTANGVVFYGREL